MILASVSFSEALLWSLVASGLLGKLSSCAVVAHVHWRVSVLPWLVFQSCWSVIGLLCLGSFWLGSLISCVGALPCCLIVGRVTEVPWLCPRS